MKALTTPTTDRERTTPIDDVDVRVLVPELRDGTRSDDELPRAFLLPGVNPAHAEIDRGVSWQLPEQPRARDDASIEILQPAEGGFLARFALALASVSSAALRSTAAQWSEHGTISPGEAVRQRALTGLACSIQPNHRLRFVHAACAKPGQPTRYRMTIEGDAHALDPQAAVQQARELKQSLRVALAVGVDQFRFAEQARDQPGTPPQWMDRVELLPMAIHVTHGSGMVVGSTPARSQREAWLPIAAGRAQTYLESVVPALTSLPVRTELIIEWHGPRLDAAAIAVAERDVRVLLDASSRLVRFANAEGHGAEVPPVDLKRTHGVLQAWLADPVGARMRVWIQSLGRIPISLARMIGQEVFLSRPFVVRRAAGEITMHDCGTSPVIDLSGLVTVEMPVAPLFPEPSSADAQGLQRHFPFVTFDPPRCGVVLGDSPGRDLDSEIVFAGRDREQHCCVIGSSGSGKTHGVLIPMVLQDMASGAGVFNICMAGDAHDYLVAACPPERLKDLVVLDFTDFTASPGLNLLELQTKWPTVERGFIVSNLVQIIRQQYPDVPEAFGPMFELYFTMAAKLVMESPDNTILDIISVFADPMFRRNQIALCRDPSVREFWTCIALRAGGEASLDNMAPYIVCKLTRFADDVATSRVIGQTKSTVDLRALMDRKAIVLAKLSKGLLSDAGARFLGMLLTTRLFGAPLSRADVPPHKRVPVNVYLDEFQNLISPALEGMLAESRKYGLRLTLATQSLAALPQGLAQAVLTNCSTKVTLRTGPQDAGVLAPWFEPHFAQADLMGLPNRQAVTRMLIDGVLSPPFVMRTRELPALRPSPELDARVAAIKAESRRRYCVDAEVIDQRIEARRVARSRREHRSESGNAPGN